MMTFAHTLDQLEDLGARIDALEGLGAGFAASMRFGTLDADQVYFLMSTYASGLSKLRAEISTSVRQLAIEAQDGRVASAASPATSPSSPTHTQSGPRPDTAAKPSHSSTR